MRKHSFRCATFSAKVTQIGGLLYKSLPKYHIGFTHNKKAPPDSDPKGLHAPAGTVVLIHSI